MLNEMRLGRISDDTVKAFKSMSRPLTSEDGLEVTELSVYSPEYLCIVVIDNAIGFQRGLKLRIPIREDCESSKESSTGTMLWILATHKFAISCFRI